MIIDDLFTQFLSAPHFQLISLINTLIEFKPEYRTIYRIPHPLKVKDNNEYPQLFWNIKPQSLTNVNNIKQIVDQNGICCVGLINLLKLIITKSSIPASVFKMGHHYRGLNGWMAFLEKHSLHKPIRCDTLNQLKIGDLLIHYNKTRRQGHMAIIYEIDRPAVDLSDIILVHAMDTNPADDIGSINCLTWDSLVQLEIKGTNILLDRLKDDDSLSDSDREKITRVRNKNLNLPTYFNYSVPLSTWLFDFKRH